MQNTSAQGASGAKQHTHRLAKQSLSHFETAGGPEAEEDGEEASAKKADRLATIEEVVKVLKGVVGGDWMTASRQKDDLTFVCFASARDGRMPWEMVEEKQADWRRYVEAKQGEITM